MRWLPGVLVLLVTTPALAFEGEIDAKSIGGGPGAAMEMQIFVSAKGDVRMNTTAKGPDGKTYRGGYITPAKGKYNYALDYDRKQATKIKKSTVAKLTQDQKSGDKGKPANVEVKKLGKDSVAGQSTRHIQVIDKDDGTTADLWLSDKYPAKLWLKVFSLGGDEGKNPSGQWAQIMQAKYGVKPGFIMKATSMSDGRKAGLEVTKIQEKKVPAKMFVVPADFKVSEAPDFGGAPPSMQMPKTKEEAEKMRDEWMKRMQQQQR